MYVKMENFIFPFSMLIAVPIVSNNIHDFHDTGGLSQTSGNGNQHQHHQHQHNHHATKQY